MNINKNMLNENIIDNNLNSEPWLLYKRPFVRDLAFAIACPDMLKHWITPDPNLASPEILVHDQGFWQTQYNNYAQRLYELDTTQAYQDLTRYLMSRPSPYRLGFHFEGLIHFWLEDGHKLDLHPYTVLAHNIQLYNGTQTTGELDFILKNHDTGDVEHWELSIKFYIGSAPYHFVNWVGINSKDNLERKLIHMQTKPFRSVWVDLDCYDKVKIDKRYVVMKGRFFQPLSAQSTRPEWLADTFPMHIWHRIESVNDFESLKTPNLRPSHYIEWFTYRPFYDASYLTNYLKNSLKNTGNSIDPLKSSDDDILQNNNNLDFNNLDINNQKQISKKRLLHWPFKSLAFEDLETNLYFSNGEHVVLMVNK